MRGPVDEARALEHLARQDAGPLPADAEERAEWRREMRAEFDDYEAGRALAVGTDRLDTVRRAIRAGRYDAPACQDIAEALATAEHAGMTSWRSTPYGLVWTDDMV
ncbi:hypothetical protein [Streptomyces parvus]|uniref:hypothetical protein n=1 Tax=Streptomyces parvus TaxID=66428 RepID=UPI0033F58250